MQAVERLLAPSGKLFRAMHSADADGLIKFVFPLERLPTHTQLLLTSDASRHAACPTLHPPSSPLIDTTRHAHAAGQAVTTVL